MLKINKIYQKIKTKYFWLQLLTVVLYVIFGIGLIFLALYTSQLSQFDLVSYSSKDFQNTSFVWKDDFVNTNNFVVEKNKNVESENQSGYISFGYGKNKLKSSCIDLTQKDELITANIDIYKLKDFDTKLSLQDCTGQNIHTFGKLVEGKNSFDMGLLNLPKSKYRLNLDIESKNIFGFLPVRNLKVDSWSILSFQKNSLQTSIKPSNNNILPGEDVTFEIAIGSKNSIIPNSNLIVDMARTNKLTGNPYRKLRLVKVESNNFESKITLPDDLAMGQVLIPLPESNQGQTFQLSITLKVEDGFTNKDKIQLVTNLDFNSKAIAKVVDKIDKIEGSFESTNKNIDGIPLESNFVEVQSQAKLVQTKYDRYSNLSPSADKLWTLFFLDNQSRDNSNIKHSDSKDYKLRVKLAQGSCKPIFKSASISKLLDNDNFDKSLESKQFNQFKVTQTPVEGSEVAANDMVEVVIDYWSFDNIYRGLVVNYDIKGSRSCQEGSVLQFVSELYQGEDLVQTENVEHAIQKNTCVYQSAEARDVLRINQTTLKPDNSYWPEWRIGLEANCNNMQYLRNDKSAKQSQTPLGLVAPGEYFWVNYWANEGFRTNTVNIDWLYVNYIIPKGLSFHGTFLDLSNIKQGNFYPTRPDYLNQDSQVEFYKSDANNSVSPSDSKFDHNNPVNSGWYKIQPDQVPLKVESDITNPTTSVYYENGKKMTILARAKNFQPAWKKDFFLPVFVMKACDNQQGCTQLKDGERVTTNQMETFTLSEGKCESCGKSNFGTIQIGQKSFPKVILESDSSTKNNSNINLTLTPENQIMASQAVDGIWSLDLSSTKDKIDWSTLQVGSQCKGCKLPEKCDLTKIITTLATENKPIVTWDLSQIKECQPARGFGMQYKGNLCKDGFNQNFQFTVSFKVKSTGNYNFEAKVIPNNAVDVSIWSADNYTSKVDVSIL